jgi:hypothetical protein
MNRILLALTIFLPCTALADSDCRVVEYQDYYEVVCLGNEKSIPESEPSEKETAVSEKQTQSFTAKTAGPGHISRSRLDAAIKTRNKLIQSERQKVNF